MVEIFQAQRQVRLKAPAPRAQRRVSELPGTLRACALAGLQLDHRRGSVEHAFASYRR